jgi:hypothetical protein
LIFSVAVFVAGKTTVTDKTPEKMLEMTGEITTRAKCKFKQTKDTLFSLGEEEHF